MKLRVTGLHVDGKKGRLELAGCNLRCPYCVHTNLPFYTLTIDTIFERLEGIESIYVGGAEPLIQKRALIPLLRELGERGVYITLKTDGADSRALESVLPYVDRVVIELKGDLDDEIALKTLTGLDDKPLKRYIREFKRSIRLVKNKKTRLWIRVIPGFVNPINFRKMLEEIGEVEEIMLYQFLSDPSYDKPFGEHNMKPEWELVEELAVIALDFSSKVIQYGDNHEIKVRGV
jgi:pyruvate formate lyase activating enzyme